MPGDPSTPAGEQSRVRCPVHRVEITPCDESELAPLLAHLHADRPAQGDRRFPRGTLTEDGRLDLCKQSLGADNCLRLAQALQHNTQVRSLMLGTDAIGDAGAAAVARLVQGNERLEVVYLGCNNIGPQGARALGAAIGQAPHVSGLWLKRNPIGAEGAASLAQMLRGNRHLRTLDLVNTDLRDAGVQALVDALCTGNHGLQALYLSGNGLGPSAAGALARLLREAPQVTALYLSVNHLGDEGAVALADALRENRTLQTLELASNAVGPDGARALFDATRLHPVLHTLNLGYGASTRVLGARPNRLGDEGAREACRLLAAPSALRRLDLSRNGITPLGVAALAEAAAGNERLVRLNVDASLPESLERQLARNRARHGDVAPPADVAAIRSVYR